MTRLARAIGVLALALSQAAAAQGKVQTFRGYLIDNDCAKDNRGKPGWAETHDRDCLSMSMCVRTGYTVMNEDDDTILQLDDRGMQLARALVNRERARATDWRIVVTGTRRADRIRVKSLRLAP